MKRSFFRPRFGLLLLSSFLFETGCSSKTSAPWGTAAGTVRIHGQPLTEGTVVFANGSLGVVRMAPIQADGSYQQRSVGYPGLPVGTYRVAITAQRISKGDFVPAGRAKLDTPTTPIPPRFRKTSTSGLAAEVKQGNNPPFDFDLKP